MRIQTSSDKIVQKASVPTEKKIIAIATHDYEHEIELLSLLWMLFSFATSTRYLDDDDECVSFFASTHGIFIHMVFYHSAN